MVSSIKALIVVFALAAGVFYAAKPVALKFMSFEDFSRRRKTWFLLTGVSFISPSFWLYTLVSVPVLVWAYRRESNPIALYSLLLNVIPPVGVIIPLLGNNGLFPMDNFRLLALCVLLPATVRYRKQHKPFIISAFGVMDVLLLAFGALQIALYTCPDLPHHSYIPDSPTNVLRRALLFFLDAYLLYYSVSRVCQSRAMLLDVSACLCLAGGLMSGIATFEHAKDWLLYVDIASRWGTDPNASFYLMRGGAVRAQASTGHSIALGSILAVIFGFWLYLKTQVFDRKHRVGGTLLLLSGLIATVSRGGWLGAVIVYFTFKAVGPRALSRVAKGAAISSLLAGLVMLSPLGDTVTQMLPQSGQPADLYRHRLAERGWEVVFAHPIFGDQFPWPEMEDLRQGEGIIDLVNTYLSVALNYGLFGLSCFSGFILLAVHKVYSRAKKFAVSDPDLALFGASLIACIVGMLAMLDSSGFAVGPERMFYLLAGLATGYAHVARTQKTATSVPAIDTAT